MCSIFYLQFMFALPTWILPSQISSPERFLTRLLRIQLGPEMRLDLLSILVNLRHRLAKADENSFSYCCHVGMQTQSAHSRDSALARDWQRGLVEFASVKLILIRSIVL